MGERLDRTLVAVYLRSNGGVVPTVLLRRTGLIATKAPGIKWGVVVAWAGNPDDSTRAHKKVQKSKAAQPTAHYSIKQGDEGEGEGRGSATLTVMCSARG